MQIYSIDLLFECYCNHFCCDNTKMTIFIQWRQLPGCIARSV